MARNTACSRAGFIAKEEKWRGSEYCVDTCECWAVRLREGSALTRNGKRCGTGPKTLWGWIHWKGRVIAQEWVLCRYTRTLGELRSGGVCDLNRVNGLLRIKEMPCLG